ncbi:glycosyl transferase family 1 [Methanohalophilus halophilus]|nr:glycosyl transferase family 1 [Methanohalophilus halophilus]
MFAWESLHSVKVGGLAPHVSELSENLVDLGHSVHIFTRNNDLEQHEKINGVHYHRVDHDSSGDIVHQMDSMCNSMYSMFQEVSGSYGDFDVIHIHDWHPVNVLCRIKRKYGLPSIITYHSTEWGRNGNVYSGGYHFEEISHREWKGGYEASHVIVTSLNFKKEIQHLYQIPDYKISVIPNGISQGRIKKEVDQGKIKTNFGFHPFAPVVLFVGRMSYQKGPDMLVEAIPKILERHWNVRFMFIGEGEMRPYCESSAKEHGVSDYCIFSGYASDEIRRDWINACDIMCVPSRNEPFGIVVLEAWDACKNIVATKAVDIIDNFENGVLVQQNPDSIAWGINYVLDNVHDDIMGRMGHDLINSKYEWKNIAKQTTEIYDNVVEKE